MSRKKINDYILQKYTDIEQVGFISNNRKKPKLVMAGGEFCVNATRSAINYYLDNKPGKIKIKIPNLHSEITGGIDKNGQTWLYLDSYISYRIKYSKLIDREVIIISFKGIEHAITDSSIIKGKTNREIKDISYNILKELKLLKYKAAGVIYISEEDGVINTTPVVYVKKVNTLYIETACGSGSAAVAIYYYINYNATKCMIKQLSGMYLHTKIYRNNDNSIKKIKISGMVSEIKK